MGASTCAGPSRAQLITTIPLYTHKMAHNGVTHYAWSMTLFGQN